MASAPLTVVDDDPIYLRIVARGGLYDFYYGVKPDEWRLLKGDVDGSILSTKVAQGFVGTLFGLYAFTLGK